MTAAEANGLVMAPLCHTQTGVDVPKVHRLLLGCFLCGCLGGCDTGRVGICGPLTGLGFIISAAAPAGNSAVIHHFAGGNIHILFVVDLAWLVALVSLFFAACFLLFGELALRQIALHCVDILHVHSRPRTTLTAEYRTPNNIATYIVI